MTCSKLSDMMIIDYQFNTLSLGLGEARQPGGRGGGGGVMNRVRLTLDQWTP